MSPEHSIDPPRDPSGDPSLGPDLPFLEDLRAATRVGMSVAFTAKHAPERLALCGAQGMRSFAELNANANRLVRALRRRGLRAGDSVALMCSNRPEFAEVLFAVLRAGLRFTCMSFLLQDEEAGYIADDCEARAFIADSRVAAVAARAAPRAPKAEVRWAIGGPIDGFESYDAALSAESGADIADPSPGRFMLYTSGTTGRPKGVVREGRRSEPRAQPAAPLVPGESVVLATGPVYHAAPLVGTLHRPLHVGATVVLMDGFDPEECLRLIEQHRVTHTHMVATMFHRLLALPETTRRRHDLSSLQSVRHGAAPTPVHVKRAMIEWLGPIVSEYYAATEGAGTTITSEEWLRKPGSVGRPADPEHVQILDERGQPLPRGTVGTVYLSAPREGGRFHYFKDPQKTASAYRGESFTLGDQGFLDADGYLFLTGRTSEVIIAGGVNVYPAEVDAVLLQHPAVADVATVGVPHEERGEEVKAVVQLKPGAQASPALEAELVAFCRERLAHFKCPRSVDFDAALPRTDAGKVFRSRLRERYWQGKSRQI